MTRLLLTFQLNLAIVWLGLWRDLADLARQREREWCARVADLAARKRRLA